MGTMASLAGVGSIMQAFGAYNQGQAQMEQADYQAQVAKNNAQIAASNARYETSLGEYSVGIEQQKGAQLIGTQRATAGAHGIDPNSGSAARLQGDTAALTAEGVNIIRNNAARRAYAYTSQSNDYTTQALLDEGSGVYAAKKGTMDAWTALAGGASSVAEKWKLGTA